MHAVFVTCLVGGAVATLLFTVLGWTGAAHSGDAHGGHVHAGHAHGGDVGHGDHMHSAHAAGNPGGHWLTDALGWALSWLSPLTLAAGAVWFGGVGLLLEGSVFGLPLAILAAICGALIIRATMGALVRSSTPPLQLGAEGALATVNATIKPNAAGEVLYTLEGLHRSLPARSVDGSTIPRGTEVVITRKEGGMAWVEPLDPLSMGEDSYSEKEQV